MATTFDDLPTLRSSPSSSSPSSKSRRKSIARRLERCCCRTLGYFPLAFVYGLTGWAVWVAVNIAFHRKSGTFSYLKAAFVVSLYLLANVSYSIAVFTSPGSPLDERIDLSLGKSTNPRGNYEGLPTYEEEDATDDNDETEFDTRRVGPMTTVTAKSSGQPRYCKKCRSIKPDRAHHCSTCGRCVLKMDHHCPWLATCVGLRNYKAFMLFLIYTSLFCWVCFSYSAGWVWAEILDDVQMEEGMQVVNTILLAVLAGVIGLVLTGFAGWHLYLTLTGQTTIESLEKTRYLAPLQKSLEVTKHTERRYLADEPDVQTGLQSISNQLKTIHANALPGVLRGEEGESTITLTSETTQDPAPSAKDHLMRSFASIEAQREHDRYAAYLDERDSERLPNAFDLGWKQNFIQVFGRQIILWFVPKLNSPGDGWQWEISLKWQDARDVIARDRASRKAPANYTSPARRSPAPPPPGWQSRNGTYMQQIASQGSHTSSSNEGEDFRMHTMNRTQQPSQDLGGLTNDSSGEERRNQAGTANWNDVPEDLLRQNQNYAQNRGRSSAQTGKGKGD